MTRQEGDKNNFETLYKAVFDQTAFGVLVSNSEGILTDVNETGCRMLGYSLEELDGHPLSDFCVGGGFLNSIPGEIDSRLEAEQLVYQNLLRKDGSVLPVEGVAQALPDFTTLAIIRDLSREKKTEEEIRHVSRLYATLSQVNQTIVRVRDRKTLFRTICEIAVEYGMFDLAAIGLLDRSCERLTIAEYRGTSDGEPYSVVNIGIRPYDEGLSATAIRTGETVTSDCVLNDGRTSFWRDEASRRKVRSVAAVPFKLGERVIGVLSLASTEHGYFGAKEKSLLSEIGMDISFALDMIELEAERTRAEAALKESEERYRSVYENSQLGLYRTTPDGKIIMANPSLIRMLGYDSFEQLAARDLKKEGFEPRYSREEFMRRIETDGEIRGLESAWTTKDGRAMYIRESARAIRDADGNTLYYEGAIEDVTERKIAEQALRTSEDRFRTLFENAPVSLWEEDFSEVKKTLANLKASGVADIRAYLAGNLDELDAMFHSVKVLSVNKTTLSLYHAVSVLQLMRAANAVSDPDAGPAHVDTIESIWEGKTAYETETVIKTLTGERRHIILKWKVVPGFEHDYSKMLVSMSDITPLRNFEKELEDSREMYRELVENIDEVIFSLDSDGILLYASRAFERYFGTGYLSKLGSHFGQFVHPDDRSAVAGNFDEQKRGSSKPFECRFIVKGGLIKWGMVHPVPVFKKGRFVGIRGSVLDITERKEAEMRSLRLGEELRALASGLQSAREEERISIAREIHDELGQGLTTLKLGIALVRRSLMENPSSKKVASEIGELSGLSKSVDDLVNSVRRISASLRPEVLDELGLAEAITWYADQISAQSNIECAVRITPPKIRIDDELSTVLFRICQEALTNVARHSGATKAEVVLRKRSGEVSLSVKDNGVGISRENISDKNSIGLLGMKERAFSIGGEFSVGPAKPKGTIVNVVVRLRGTPPSRPGKSESIRKA